MTKQFSVFHVSWRDARRKPVGLFANERDYARAAATALQERLNALAEEGWIVNDILPGYGLTAKDTACFTVVAFR